MERLRIFTKATLIMAVVIFFGCAKDDNENTPQREGKVKYVKSMVVRGPAYWGSRRTKSMEDIKYDGRHRVVSCRCNNGEEYYNVTFDYRGNDQLIVSVGDFEKYVATLNSDGYITSVICVNGAVQDEHGTFDRILLSYDQGGHLVKAETTSAHGDDGRSLTCTYTWEQGNIASIMSDDSLDGISIRKFSYVSQVSTMNLDIFYYIDDFIPFDLGEELFEVGLFGFFGRSSKNLLTRDEMTEGYEKGFFITHTYDFDEEGNVIQRHMREHGSSVADLDVTFAYY